MLEGQLKDPRVWRFSREVAPATETVPSGFAELDALLPGRGWPVGALTEILSEVEGIGALRLVLPALARLSQAERWLAWIAPPHLPYAPALAAHGVELARVLIIDALARPAERFWALDQSLRAGACSAVLAWWSRADWHALRRLQLAAEAGRSCGLLFRPMAACREASPAALRLVLEPSGPRTAVRIIKRRGGAIARPLILDLRVPGL
jgi:hypothetical protein